MFEEGKAMPLSQLAFTLGASRALSSASPFASLGRLAFLLSARFTTLSFYLSELFLMFFRDGGMTKRASDFICAFRKVVEVAWLRSPFCIVFSTALAIFPFVPRQAVPQEEDHQS